MSGRCINITESMREDAKTLIKLMGCPVIQAPCEAESQCVTICKSGLAYATASEDMDCMPLGCPFQLRNFNNAKEPITEVCLEKVLEGFQMNQKEFIDLCILCGCDYTHNIGGVGPVKAFNLMKELCLYDEDVGIQIVENGGIKIILKAMEKYFDVASMQVAACEIIGFLLLKGKSEIHAPKLAKAIITAMKNHGEAVDVQIQACDALFELSQVPTTRLILKKKETQVERNIEKSFIYVVSFAQKLGISCMEQSVETASNVWLERKNFLRFRCRKLHLPQLATRMHRSKITC